jgi:hypothetical protein
MLPFTFFQEALPYESFLTTHGSLGDKTRWDRARGFITLSPEQLERLKSFKRHANLLILAGPWCGDCSTQCAPLEAFAQAQPLLQIRYLDRDAYPAAQQQLQVNGGNRVPVVLFYSEDGFEVCRYGDRVATTYERLSQGADPHDLGLDDPTYAEGVTADWLREVERVQRILRLSPRLRRLHQD